jgi:hypothetical protein
MENVAAAAAFASPAGALLLHAAACIASQGFEIVLWNIQFVVLTYMQM